MSVLLQEKDQQIKNHAAKLKKHKYTPVDIKLVLYLSKTYV